MSATGIINKLAMPLVIPELSPYNVFFGGTSLRRVRRFPCIRRPAMTEHGPPERPKRWAFKLCIEPSSVIQPSTFACSSVKSTIYILTMLGGAVLGDGDYWGIGASIAASNSLVTDKVLTSEMLPGEGAVDKRFCCVLAGWSVPVRSGVSVGSTLSGQRN